MSSMRARSGIPTSLRRRPKQERSKETVEAILDATARVLVREGYDKANTNRIARVAGVSIGSLYQYFPNKEALVAAVARRHLEEIKSVMGLKFREVANAPLPVAARELVRAMIRLHAVDPELHRALARLGPRAARREQGDSLDPQMIGMVRSFLAKHEGEIRPENLDLAALVVAQTVESLTHAAVLEWPQHLKDEQQLVDEVSAAVLGYLDPTVGTGRNGP